MQATIDNQTARHRSACIDTAVSFAAHPAGTRHRVETPDPTDRTGPVERPGPADRCGDEQGSLVTEYGLLAVVAATLAGVVIQWASGGALVTLFNALLRQARALVGA